MNPTFYVNLGPVKLSDITKLISAEIVGLKQDREFKNISGIEDVVNIDDTITFVYENYRQQIDLPKKVNLVISNLCSIRFF